MLYPCSGPKCEKSIHISCMNDYITKNQLEHLPQDVVCCATKAHHARCMSQSSLAPIALRWDMDGPGGGNTVPNSMWVILDWWTCEGKYSKYHGGKNHGGRNKNVLHVYLSERIKTLNCKVVRPAHNIAQKIGQMESQFKDASDWLNATGAGLVDQGKDVSDYVKKLCPFFYIIEDIMADRACINPLALSEEIDLTMGIEVYASKSSPDNNDDSSEYVFTCCYACCYACFNV
jgi:hypothetical protein